MDRLIGEYQIQLVEPECAPGIGQYGVQINLPGDISAVFPYLNAKMDNAWYDHEGKVLILREQNQAYAFRPNEIRVARVRDHPQAERISDELINEVNRVWQERDGITPRFTERKLPTVIDIYKLLPKMNCKLCGYTTCLAYAAELRTGQAQLVQCPLLANEKNIENREKIKGLFEAV